MAPLDLWLSGALDSHLQPFEDILYISCIPACCHTHLYLVACLRILRWGMLLEELEHVLSMPHNVSITHAFRSDVAGEQYARFLIRCGM